MCMFETVIETKGNEKCHIMLDNLMQFLKIQVFYSVTLYQ